MSSALWHFFWTEGDWTGAPAPTPSPSPSPSPSPPPPPASPLPGPPEGSGGGGGKGKGKGQGKGHDKFYEEVPQDLWAVREAYLRSLFEQVAKPAPRKSAPAEEVEPPPAPPPGPVHNFFPQNTSKLAEAVSALRLAQTTEELKRTGAKIVQLQRERAAAEQAQRLATLEAENARLTRRIEREAQKKAAATAAKLLLRTLGKS